MIGFTHIQEEPAHVWTVEHNLNTRSPILDSMLLEGGEHVKALPKEVKMVDMNVVEIHWSFPAKGRARIV